MSTSSSVYGGYGPADGSDTVSTTVTVDAALWQPPAMNYSMNPAQPGRMCMTDGTAAGAYMMEYNVEYGLKDLAFGANMNVRDLEIHGVYYEPFGLPPVSAPFLVSLDGLQYELNTWVPSDFGCAAFSVRAGIQPTLTQKGGRLEFVNPDRRFAPSVILFSVKAFVQTAPSIGLPSATTGDTDILPGFTLSSTATVTSATDSSSKPVAASSSSSGPKASVLAPAIIVPVVLLLLAGVGFLLLQRRRRARMAPSAAFRADHASAVEAMERSGAPVGLGAAGMSAAPAAISPAQHGVYFPLDEKRPLVP